LGIELGSGNQHSAEEKEIASNAKKFKKLFVRAMSAGLLLEDGGREGEVVMD
jgi:hypothetical protein